MKPSVRKKKSMKKLKLIKTYCSMYYLDSKRILRKFPPFKLQMLYYPDLSYVQDETYFINFGYQEAPYTYAPY